MNIQIDKNTMVVGLIALVVGAGVGFAGAHHDRYEGTEGGRWSQDSNENGRGGMMHDISKVNDGQGMQESMHTMMSSLDGKTGGALDVAFLEEMTVHHQGAIDMANTLLKGTKRPELIKLANDIIAAQTKEIEQMNAWRAAWFSATATPAE